jgi:DNA-directed RNA polymerase specialized sigma24 family protein
MRRSRTPQQSRHPSDADVVAAAAGDRHAWDRLVDRHAEQVWATVRGRGLDGPVAARVCQLTWLRLADHLDELTSHGAVREWVGAVADREAVVAVRGLAPATATDVP